MANDNQIAGKKRIIYAEDLFEPVDVNVFYFGGRSGGKTMAMYEQLFRKRVEMAPTIDAVEVVRCKDCKSYNHDYRYCQYLSSDPRSYNTDSVDMDPEDFCSYGERKD